ncbi:MAG: hypothetical protein OEX04_03530 [Acidimicrobiia bacterium]|nr:hypothetical protein [Acidimicrobiia bacterium]MDH4306527.1 hypothetical protein [Acidimicrobiia bacterium]MDH5292549.1 hypothetical protein [Acidimicrobiia bacterium]
MLATLRIPAVLLGLGAGALTATVVSLSAALVFQLIGAEGGARAGLIPGIITGFLVAGYLAGRMALVAHRFHGAVTGLALVALVVFVAQGGGGEANAGQILLLAVIGMLVGGVGGVLGGRRTQSKA